jgi:hypothetical protein
LWRWRRQLLSLRQQRHLGLPLAIASVPLLGTLLTLAGDRALLLALPALAAHWRRWRCPRSAAACRR